MTEAWKTPVGMAWGCNDNRHGWVPYPKTIPRRNPIIDAVGRIDDPCDRPAYNLPDFAPKPSFRNEPREGTPNNICNLEDYEAEREEVANAQESGNVVNITVGPGTPHEICLKAEPILQTDCVYANPPTIEDCCKDARSLDVLKGEVKKILGPHEELEMGMKNWSECQSPCHPLVRKYPCRGVIRSPRPDWLKVPPEKKCKPSLASSMGEPGRLEDYKPLTGREFTEGMRTCDIYPIHPNLPKRFNNAEWFKGYGCESLAHPFYVTTAMDYGRFPPTAHTMTQCYYPKQTKFTDHLCKGGMPRNRSLNLANDKTVV